jgi:hypothetical protein
MRRHLMNALLAVADDRNPLKLLELMNTIVAFMGGAIAAMFALAILAMAAGLVFTAGFEAVQWFAHLM